jgi:hypothetical protein
MEPLYCPSDPSRGHSAVNRYPAAILCAVQDLRDDYRWPLFWPGNPSESFGYITTVSDVTRISLENNF